ncbi:helix-turn-helix domain-containing protein [Actinokineospora sp. 24-640]
MTTYARQRVDDHAGATLGRRIAYHRLRCGYSQRDLAALVNRSESWVSQVERGVRRIDRMSVLRVVADAVRAPLDELVTDTPLTGAVAERPDTADGLRLLLAAGVTPWSTADSAAREGDELLPARVGEAADLARRARYEVLPGVMAPLLFDLERAARAASAGRRTALHALAARAYLIAADALCRLGDTTSAWLAADRAARAAERSGDRSQVAVCAAALVRVLSVSGRHVQAEHTAGAAIRALLSALPALPAAPVVDVARAHTADPEVQAVAALLWLETAMASARRHDRDQARRALDRAGVALDRVRRDRMDDFPDGPVRISRVDLALTEVSAAVELGEAATALRQSVPLSALHLPADRAVQLKLDIARAHLQRGDTAGVVRATLEAELLAPGYVRQHHWVRPALRNLARAAAAPSPALLHLAARCGLDARVRGGRP